MCFSDQVQVVFTPTPNISQHDCKHDSNIDRDINDVTMDLPVPILDIANHIMFNLVLSIYLGLLELYAFWKWWKGTLKSCMWADLTNTFGQDELHSLTFVFNYKSSIFVTCDCFPDLISLLRMIPIHIDSLIILIFSWLSDISNKTQDYVQPQHWFSKPILLPNRYRIVAWWTSRSQKNIILYDCVTVSCFTPKCI